MKPFKRTKYVIFLLLLSTETTFSGPQLGISAKNLTYGLIGIGALTLAYAYVSVMGQANEAKRSEAKKIYAKKQATAEEKERAFIISTMKTHQEREAEHQRQEKIKKDAELQKRYENLNEKWISEDISENEHTELKRLSKKPHIYKHHAK